MSRQTTEEETMGAILTDRSVKLTAELLGEELFEAASSVEDPGLYDRMQARLGERVTLLRDLPAGVAVERELRPEKRTCRFTALRGPAVIGTAIRQGERVVLGFAPRVNTADEATVIATLLRLAALEVEERAG